MQFMTSRAHGSEGCPEHFCWPFPLLRTPGGADVDFVVEFWVIDVKFTGIYTDNRTW